MSPLGSVKLCNTRLGASWQELAAMVIRNLGRIEGDNAAAIQEHRVHLQRCPVDESSGSTNCAKFPGPRAF